MATGYEAVAHLRVTDVPPGEDAEVVRRLTRGFRVPVTTATAREDDDLVVTVSVRLVGADSSQVQLRAQELCRTAAREAGLDQQVRSFDDIGVRSGS
jgi:hypothetical protein